MEEIWKDIDGFEGEYQVSNLGRVRSLERSIYRGRKKIYNFGRILKCSKNEHGYLICTIYSKPQKKCILVHTLVANSFFGKGNNDQEINHKNGIKTDNRVENLEWCTRSENMLHRYRILGNKDLDPNTNIQRHKRLKSILQFDINENFIKEYYSMSEASFQTNVSRSLLSQCASGKLKTAGGFIWKCK